MVFPFQLGLERKAELQHPEKQSPVRNRMATGQRQGEGGTALRQLAIWETLQVRRHDQHLPLTWQIRVKL